MERTRLLLNSEEPVKWLFTGDSITHGGVFTYGRRDYVQIFEERLRYELERGRDFVIRTAIGGWSTELIKHDIEWNILQFNPHVVSIMIGMNDAGGGPGYVDAFAENYRAILDAIAERTGARVILHTPNPIMPGLDPTREPALPLIAEKVRELGKDRDIPVIDHYTYWQQAWRENPRRIYSWMGDAIHPNAFGQRAFAHLLIKELGIWHDASLCCRLMVP